MAHEIHRNLPEHFPEQNLWRSIRKLESQLRQSSISRFNIPIYPDDRSTDPSLDDGQMWFSVADSALMIRANATTFRLNGTPMG